MHSPKLVIAVGCLLFMATLTSSKADPALAPETHQFDFWAGKWDVFDSDGKPAGSSHVDSIAEGNGLLENWTDASGTTGKSLNVYNAGRKCWQQFWVGNGTPVLELAGTLVGHSMVLSGVREGRAGTQVMDRITWTPNPDASVTQRWESSTDGGMTWRDNFLGIYRHKKSA